MSNTAKMLDEKIGDEKDLGPNFLIDLMRVHSANPADRRFDRQTDRHKKGALGQLVSNKFGIYSSNKLTAAVKKNRNDYTIFD